MKIAALYSPLFVKPAVLVEGVDRELVGTGSHEVVQ